VSCDFLGSYLEGNFDAIRLFQAIFDQIVWHAISIQRRPASVPVKLPLKDKILIWTNILYRVLDMSTQYNILYHTTQYIFFTRNLFFHSK
jgi:hypothetical protein